jgi:uncharacterized membrane protein YpjA
MHYFSARVHSLSVCSHILLFGSDMMHSVSTLLFGYDAWTIVAELIMNGHNFISFSAFTHITFFGYGAWTIVAELIMNGHNFISFSAFTHITFFGYGAWTTVAELIMNGTNLVSISVSGNGRVRTR